MTNCGTDKNINKKCLLIDLIAILGNYNGKIIKEKNKPIDPAAYNFIKKLSKDYRIIIYTPNDIKSTIEWLKDNNLLKLIEEITSTKSRYASIILDNFAINFDGDFNKAYKAIKEFKPYWED